MSLVIDFNKLLPRGAERGPQDETVVPPGTGE